VTDTATQIEEALLSLGEATELELANRLNVTLSAISNGLKNLLREGRITHRESTNGLIWRLA
jgi:predicted transcriptional regulator